MQFMSARTICQFANGINCEIINRNCNFVGLLILWIPVSYIWDEYQVIYAQCSGRLKLNDNCTNQWLQTQPFMTCDFDIIVMTFELIPLPTLATLQICRSQETQLLLVGQYANIWHIFDLLLRVLFPRGNFLNLCMDLWSWTWYYSILWRWTWLMERGGRRHLGEIKMELEEIVALPGV